MQYRVQVQPNYFNDTYKIAIWADSNLSLIDDLARALAPLGNVHIINTQDETQNQFAYYIQTNQGDLGLVVEHNVLTDNGGTHSLRPQQNPNIIFTTKRALVGHHCFDVDENLKHPFFEKLTWGGYAFAAITVVFLELIVVYGDPDFEADIKGVSLGFLSLAMSCVAIVKFTGIRFVLRRMNEKFPDPINLNYIAFAFAILQGVFLLLFL